MYGLYYPVNISQWWVNHYFLNDHKRQSYSLDKRKSICNKPLLLVSKMAAGGCLNNRTIPLEEPASTQTWTGCCLCRALSRRGTTADIQHSLASLFSYWQMSHSDTAERSLSANYSPFIIRNDLQRLLRWLRAWQIIFCNTKQTFGNNFTSLF